MKRQVYLISLLFLFQAFNTKQVNAAMAFFLHEEPDTTAVQQDSLIQLGWGGQSRDVFAGFAFQLKKDKLNQGFLTSPHELMVGKIPGLRISSFTGQPGGGYQMVNRGIATLSLSLPLFFVDDMPFFDVSPILNPEDIESITLLQNQTGSLSDANPHGGIVLATKKGTDNFHVSYTGQMAVSTLPNKIDVYSGDEFRQLVNEHFAGSSDAPYMLGRDNTDWQSEVYRTAVGHQHHVGVSGTVGDFLPVYASFGKIMQDGIVRTTNLDRTSAFVNLTPSFFDDHLKLNVRLSGNWSEKKLADDDVFANAVLFDPTKPVRTSTLSYGGYFAHGSEGGAISFAPRNPVALLEQKNINQASDQLFGSAKLDYKLHFLPSLRVVLNYGLSQTKRKLSDISNDDVAWALFVANYVSEERVTEKTFTGYFNFAPDLKSFPLEIDARVGYRFMHSKYEYGISGELAAEYYLSNGQLNTRGYSDRSMPSVFGHVKLGFKDRYVLNVNITRDGESRLTEDSRWTTSSGAAFVWRLNKEAFLAQFDKLSRLELQVGAASTYFFGYQNASFVPASSTTETGDYISSSTYEVNIEKEKRTIVNAAIYASFFQDRIKTSFEFYNTKSEKLIGATPVASGTGYSSMIIENKGGLRSSGADVTLGVELIRKADVYFALNGFLSYNRNEYQIAPPYSVLLYGKIQGSIDNHVLALANGKPVNSFFLNQQVYSTDGKPLEGLYENNTAAGEQQFMKIASPKVFMGINSLLSYKKWDFSFSGRVQLGQAVYNNVEALAVYQNADFSTLGYLNNLPKVVEQAGFNTQQYLSSYYAQDASFFRMDYISLGYSFRDLFKGMLKLKISGTVQNAFVITQYKGRDPEQPTGIDAYVYPRARSYALKLKFDF